MPTFDYGAHFGRIKEIERLLLHQNEIQWTEAYAKPDGLRAGPDPALTGSLRGWRSDAADDGV